MNRKGSLLMLAGLGVLGIIIGLVILAAAAGIVWYLYMKVRYRTVPSNEALIVTGPNLGSEKDPSIYKDDQGRYMKVIRGGGHRLRMFQTGTKVSLQSFQLELTTPKVYTSHGVGIFGEAVATVKVSDTLDGIVKYSEQFLGKKPKEIENEITEVLGSNLRAILSEMSVEDINADRNSFNEQVRKIAQKQLDLMGFMITALGLTNIKDDEGYLENLGRPQVSKVQKIAEIAEAENERETEIKKAEVNEEVSKERYTREMSIADIRKEKDIKEAQILADTQREKAKAEAAYELEKEERLLEVEKQRIKIREQAKENDMKMRQLERENDVKLEEQQVNVRKQQAEADYYTKTKEAEASAMARIEEGKAEAQVIKLKSDAEIEAIEKRAKALDEHQDVILMEKVIDMLPEFARAVSEPLGKVESIRILDGGKGEQVNTIPNTVTNMLSSLQESLGQMTGFNLENLLKDMSNKKDTIKSEPKEVSYEKGNLKDFQGILNEVAKEVTTKSGIKTLDKETTSKEKHN